MCGLFGLVRAGGARRAPASALLLHLGHSADERGGDAAGLALSTDTLAVGEPASGVETDLAVGRWRVVKGLGTFERLWRTDLADPLDRADVVIGHTRRATQGAVDRLDNSSPLVVDGVVGSHNGDLDAAALRAKLRLRTATVGQTDSAVLLQALSRSGNDPDAIRAALAAVTGRAAGAWAALADPGLVWLARAGLSPLAVARDMAGNLFWATNPRWIVRAAAATGAVLPRPPVPLPEGTLVAVTRSAAGVRLAGVWLFPPTVRRADLASPGVWLGFTPADVERERQLLRHRIADPAPATPDRRGIVLPAAA
jgi:glucosamine--fructose-6-phosphate aminotransferase (isomerizing)